MALAEGLQVGKTVDARAGLSGAGIVRQVVAGGLAGIRCEICKRIKPIRPELEAWVLAVRFWLPSERWAGGLASWPSWSTHSWLRLASLGRELPP